MQIGEHLAQVLRFRRYLSWQCHATRRGLGPAASSRMPLALPATACSAPLAPPERTGLTTRRETLRRTASEPLDRSSPRTGLLVRIDFRAGHRNFSGCRPLMYASGSALIDLEQ